jgi:hypothetical protein
VRAGGCPGFPCATSRSRSCNRLAGARNGAAITNARRRASEPKHVRSWSRVWEWPIPPDTYVDPEVVREFLEEEAGRGRGET